MEKAAFIGFLTGLALAWLKGFLKPVGRGEVWQEEDLTSEYYWRV